MAGKMARKGENHRSCSGSFAVQYAVLPSHLCLLLSLQPIFLISPLETGSVCVCERERERECVCVCVCELPRLDLRRLDCRRVTGTYYQISRALAFTGLSGWTLEV